MTTRLQLYNRALQICGEARLSALTDTRGPRYELDNVWDNGGVKHCLERGQWEFCTRAVQIDYDSAITPSFGYNRAFDKPTDYCCMVAVCSDEYFKEPLLHYLIESGYFYADLDTIYVRYVSNDNAYGGDLSLWPEVFTEYVAQHFAGKIITTLTHDKDRQMAILHPRDGTEHKALMLARTHDRQAKPTLFAPPSSWMRARRAGRASGFDRGGTGSLTG